MAKRTIYSGEYELLLRMLRDAREQAGVTQVTLAQRLGITQSALSKCERGELRLDVAQTRNWCRALKVPFGTFMVEYDRRAAKQ